MQDNLPVKLVTYIHRKCVSGRRIRMLAPAIAESIPMNSNVLDIGTGNGRLVKAIQEIRPDLTICGLDIKKSEGTVVPVQEFDGLVIPHSNGSWDVCMANDVLHHSQDPEQLLKEMVRVARGYVLIKDHSADSRIAWWILAIMDWIGNVGYGTVVPFNFLSSQRWSHVFTGLGLTEVSKRTQFRLYPFPLTCLLDRNLHFIVLLRKGNDQREDPETEHG